MDKRDRVLVLGASGYVGSRLCTVLLDKGYRVRAVGRSSDKLAGRPWQDHPALEREVVDVLDVNALIRASEGCSAVFYLIHSMVSKSHDFTQLDHHAAANMAIAAKEALVKRIIYLGGLGEASLELSAHLRSRAEVGRVLQRGSVPVTILRAAMILGAGSASFEILRYLVERLPVMITPGWVQTRSQPIAIQNVLDYLVGCLECPKTLGRTFDIGGPDILTYKQLFDLFADQAQLHRRLIIPIHLLFPRLSSYWIHWVTPVPASLARPLAEGLRNEAICRDSHIKSLICSSLIGCSQAIRCALEEPNWSEKTTLHEWACHPYWSYPGDDRWSAGVRRSR